MNNCTHRITDAGSWWRIRGEHHKTSTENVSKYERYTSTFMVIYFIRSHGPKELCPCLNNQDTYIYIVIDIYLYIYYIFWGKFTDSIFNPKLCVHLGYIFIYIFFFGKFMGTWPLYRLVCISTFSRCWQGLYKTIIYYQ